MNSLPAFVLFMLCTLTLPEASSAQGRSSYYYFWRDNEDHESVCYRVNIHGDLQKGVRVSTAPRTGDAKACLEARPKVDHYECVLDEHQLSVCEFVTYPNEKPIRSRVDLTRASNATEHCKAAMPHQLIYILKKIDGEAHCFRVNPGATDASSGNTFNLRVNDQLPQELQQKACHSLNPDPIEQALQDLKSKFPI